MAKKIVARKHTRSIYSIQLDMAEMAKEKAAAQHLVGSGAAPVFCIFMPTDTNTFSRFSFLFVRQKTRRSPLLSIYTMISYQ